MSLIINSVDLNNFDPVGYLIANPDLMDATSNLSSWSEKELYAKKHFLDFGMSEKRIQHSSEFVIDCQIKREEKLRSLLDKYPSLKNNCEEITSPWGPIQQKMLKSKSAKSLPQKMINISANKYDQETQNIIESNKNSLFLDLGSGLRETYFENVVNLEIDCLPTTDFLAFGEDLPFEDKTFDGAFCFAVLEHVQNPFAVASELVRVTKPGGTVIVDWPFLQPVHGFPDHYFNATESGAQWVFQNLKRVTHIETSVPNHMHPIYGLNWILNIWADGLSDSEKQSFDKLKIGTIRGALPKDQVNLSWANLERKAEASIAAGNRVKVTLNRDL